MVEYFCCIKKFFVIINDKNINILIVGLKKKFFRINSEQLGVSVKEYEDFNIAHCPVNTF